MLILKMLGGFILILIGSFMVLGFAIHWHDFGYWDAIKCQDVSFLSLDDLYPVIGLLLFSLGSFIIVKTFKGYLKCNDTITLKSRPFITSILYFWFSSNVLF